MSIQVKRYISGTSPTSQILDDGQIIAKRDSDGKYYSIAVGDAQNPIALLPEISKVTVGISGTTLTIDIGKPS